ncbi:MAG: sulfotransferase domain-containing protein, partial [Planctomycetota bacterium]
PAGENPLRGTQERESLTMDNLLSHRNPLLRKSAMALLRVPRSIKRFSVGNNDVSGPPAVLANSFPKSGTHLLSQIVGGIPDLNNYGAFLSSMTSSFQFRLRSVHETERFLNRIVPGEIVRAHLFSHAGYGELISRNNIVHFFIYRDLRDVVVSSANYLTTMNPWHRLHRHFKGLSLEDAIIQSIQGIETEPSFPNIGERFANYSGWLTVEDSYAVKYEALMDHRRKETIRDMANFYCHHAAEPPEPDFLSHRMMAGIDGNRSHTMRKGGSGGWRDAFTDRCKAVFKEIAGDLLVELGYEQDLMW